MPLSGYIKLHRSLLDWCWHDDPATGWLFVNLLLMANHIPSEWRGVEIDRGQVLTGRKALSEQTGLSEQTIRTSLNRLKSTSEITINSTNKFSLITIVNYDKFQNYDQNSTSNSTSILTSVQPAPNQHLTTNKKYKKYKKEYRACAQSSCNDSDCQSISVDFNGSDLSEQLADYRHADDLLCRYRLPDCDTSREALLEDAERVGWDVLEDALKRAAGANSRDRISVNYYRAVLNGRGKEDARNERRSDPYGGYGAL